MQLPFEKLDSNFFCRILICNKQTEGLQCHTATLVLVLDHGDGFVSSASISGYLADCHEHHIPWAVRQCPHLPPNFLPSSSLPSLSSEEECVSFQIRILIKATLVILGFWQAYGRCSGIGKSLGFDIWEWGIWLITCCTDLALAKRGGCG